MQEVDIHKVGQTIAAMYYDGRLGLRERLTRQLAPAHEQQFAGVYVRGCIFCSDRKRRIATVRAELREAESAAARIRGLREQLERLEAPRKRKRAPESPPVPPTTTPPVSLPASPLKKSRKN